MHDRHFKADEKIIVELMNSSFSNRIHRPMWWIEKWWIHFHFFKTLIKYKTCIWSPCFPFIIQWFSWNTSGETTSWIISVCSVDDGCSRYKIHQQNVPFLMRHVFQQQPLYYFHMHISQFLLLRNFFFSFTLNAFPYQLDFFSFDPWIICHLILNFFLNF